MKKIVLLISIFFLIGFLMPVKSEQGGGGNNVTCYSESKSRSGWTYYDCGDCCKYFNSKGKGTQNTCNTSSCNNN